MPVAGAAGAALAGAGRAGAGRGRKLSGPPCSEIIMGAQSREGATSGGAMQAELLRRQCPPRQVVVLDRPRHADLISQIRAVGACIHLISDGDVAAAIATAQRDARVDVLMGIGGTPEGVIAAAALKCQGGAIQAQACLQAAAWFLRPRQPPPP